MNFTFTKLLLLLTENLRCVMQILLHFIFGIWLFGVLTIKFISRITFVSVKLLNQLLFN